MSRPQRFLLLSLLLVVAATVTTADDLNRQLRDRYTNKTLLLRGFYSGTRLQYDSSGSFLSGDSPGDWTTDGFVSISEIGMKRHEIRIKARRMSAVSLNGTFSLRMNEKALKESIVEILVDLGTPRPSSNQINAALARIFVSGKDDIVSLIPDYWKPCVPAGLAGKDENCRFAPEILAIPGFSSAEKDVAEVSESKSPDFRTFRADGINPPKATLQSGPTYSEAARRMKYQGTTVLRLTVNQEGFPTKIHVVNPVGCGLDAQAVRAVEGWRFRPAEKDGRPVAVEIAVEVNFSL